MRSTKFQVPNHKQISINQIQNGKIVPVIWDWRLEFIWNLEIGICDFWF
jgi:hypothetical protein